MPARRGSRQLQNTCRRNIDAWEETSIVDHTRRPKELLLKEALHIQMPLPLELPNCLTATLR